MSSSADDLYDFILVGAGSASCLITSRLSQQLPDHRILVLEAGEHIRNDPKVQTPGLAHTLQSNPIYDWQYSTGLEPGLNERSIKHPRGKLVGGTSAINSHSIVFPNYEWHDRLAKGLLTDAGVNDWSSEGMKECYARWQDENSQTKANHDEESPDRVQTSFPRSIDFLQSQWMRVFEDFGHTAVATGFTESSVGPVMVTNAIDASKGERSHAGTAFLEPALKRGNVTLRTGVKVDKIVFDKVLTGGKLNATGVRYTHQGEEHFISGREIVLCAGVFESPLILERSGVGSKEVLAAADVPVLYELPGVGENLQDHLNCSLSFETHDDVPTRDNVYRDPEVQKAALLEYEQSRTGRLSEGAAYSFAFTPLQMLETQSETQQLTEMVRHLVEETSSPSLQAQYAFIQKTSENPHEATATTFMLRTQRNRDTDSLPKGTPSIVPGNYVTVVAMLAHPFSRGSCHISSDLSIGPVINFNYLSHPLDTEILARHLRLIERLFQQPTFLAMAKPGGRRLPRSFPHPISSLEDAKKILPINSATNYHPCGTCSMMKEELRGVVDERLKVYGTNNIRVCDASVLPIIPRGNILTAVYAFAEKAAEIICRETKASCQSD
ncbi:FAD/NAD(P)-binding protein [Glarea lozoyensis ATCC 20868]|uniref:FAD/NAD(P)-binding protein n=1 Tax=Glarea lozoyensis (strain ATCC 20868 / MF5171) TaxID=1116229 RepID=S3CBY4_GLAL2|nr:FAD/NAD(P)-binding protein [Glarea lozoyensis ATCC 20868]EPE24102.1 FAD/NAD(P)-binding protein [Glarea lozoyensis ATCC 20868]